MLFALLPTGRRRHSPLVFPQRGHTESNAPHSARPRSRGPRYARIHSRQRLAPAIGKGECLRPNVSQTRANQFRGFHREKLALRRSRNLQKRGRSCLESPPPCAHYRRRLRKFFFVWKAKCPPLVDHTTWE